MNLYDKANRREGFIRWYAWSLRFLDCDPAVWMTNYINKRYEHNDEQRLWLCWLYGNTYNLPTAWVLMNEFPDFELATQSRIEEWNQKNYKRLRYQTDTKWNKGHLPSMFASYKKFIGARTQREKITSLLGSSESESFTSLWNGVKNSLHKFGRYSTWFYLQHLKQTASVDIYPTGLMLNDYDGSKSHRNGLILALGQDDRCNSRLTLMEYNSLESESNQILLETRQRFPDVAKYADPFSMETCLCSYKKLFRNHHGRYLGYYLDRQAEEISKAEGDEWSGIEWKVLWQARNETLDKRLVSKKGIDKRGYSFISKDNSGQINRLDWLNER